MKELLISAWITIEVLALVALSGWVVVELAPYSMPVLLFLLSVGMTHKIRMDGK